MQGRVPDFFIVGHHKSGTTALYEMLSQHPEIFMSDIKEPRFLAADMRARFTPPRGRRLPETLEEYLSLFSAAAPGQRVGEASPSYLFSHTAAAGNRTLTAGRSRDRDPPRARLASCTRFTSSCCAATSSPRRTC